MAGVYRQKMVETGRIKRLGEDSGPCWGAQEERVVRQQWGRHYESAAKAHESGRGISKVFGEPTFLTWRKGSKRASVEREAEGGLGQDWVLSRASLWAIRAMDHFKGEQSLFA